MKNYLKMILFLFLMLGINSLIFGATYYIDSVGGNDSNSGTTESVPWKTLTKVSGTTFSAGDTILFKRGSSWVGQLWPKGSGASGNVITIDAYGSGAKPSLDGGGSSGILDGAVVLLYDQDYWEINNLDIQNTGATEGDRFGILVRWHNYGTGNHVYLENNDIHDVWGHLSTDERFRGDGILIVATGTVGGTPTRANDILIGNNTFARVYRTGISVWSQWSERRGLSYSNLSNYHQTVGDYYGHTNIVVRGNSLDTIGGDGILISSVVAPLIEYNVVRRAQSNSPGYNDGIWPHNSDDSVVQYNEVYETQRTTDGLGFDVDLASYDNIVQYNYSHNNVGGFLLVCCDSETKRTIIRYNISQDDQARIFKLSGDGAQIYNNTIYNPVGNNVSIYTQLALPDTNTVFNNNIIYKLGAGGYATGPIWDYNLFYGNHPASEPSDPNKLTSDPLFANNGGGGVGRDTAVAYKIAYNSPSVDSGKIIASNGGLDYFGNSISVDSPDRGAHEYTTPDGTYQATVDFSSTQGRDQWYYQEKSGSTYSNMTWDSGNNRWKGGYTYVLVGNDWQHPQVNKSVRKWEAPSNGTIEITSNGNVRKTNNSGDGVIVEALHNSTSLWSQTITDTTGVAFPTTTRTVTTGDVIYFEVDQNGTYYNDSTRWDPVITYQCETYQATVDFSSTQGRDQWYYQEKSGSTYSNMTWDSGNNRWKGGYTYVLVGNDWQHPQVNKSVRKWEAPSNGTIEITSNGNVRKTNNSGDGVIVEILHNSTSLWSQTITDTTGVAFPTTTRTVTTGDVIYFEVDQNGTYYNDTTRWDPIITLCP